MSKLSSTTNGLNIKLLEKVLYGNTSTKRPDTPAPKIDDSTFEWL